MKTNKQDTIEMMQDYIEQRSRDAEALREEIKQDLREVERITSEANQSSEWCDVENCVERLNMILETLKDRQYELAKEEDLIHNLQSTLDALEASDDAEEEG